MRIRGWGVGKGLAPPVPGRYQFGGRAKALPYTRCQIKTALAIRGKNPYNKSVYNPKRHRKTDLLLQGGDPMKKWTALALIVLMALALTGCESGVSQEDYDALRADYEAVCAELETLRRAGEGVRALASGGFTATVHALMQDYVLDESLSVAVVTTFQDYPFTVCLGEELCAQLEVGETYVFEIEETTVTLYGGHIPDLRTALACYGLRVSGVRVAQEEEMGVASLNVNFTVLD